MLLHSEYHFLSRAQGSSLSENQQSLWSAVLAVYMIKYAGHAWHM